MICYAVLLDTVSIQKYIFATNKLKHNIGASFLVEDAFGDHMVNTLRNTLKTRFPDIDFETIVRRWQEFPGNIRINNPGVPVEIGYIGGGNGLLFFREAADGQAFIREWTTGLMIYAPGIVTAVAGMDFDLQNFTQSKNALFALLEENKNRSIPQTLLPRHGITAECSESGLSMDCPNRFEPHETPEPPRYISAVANAKKNAVKAANDKLDNQFGHILGDHFCFTDQIDQLGQQKGEDSYIAVVHIDGNSMAKRFQDTQNLEETRKLSHDVANAVTESVAQLLKHITDNFDLIQEALGFDNNEKKNHFPCRDRKKILPLRPIIIGGDDITFVTNGKLGIHFAEIFMKAFADITVSDGQKLTSCAGIAAVKTKFPFYRAYELAEQLCRNAKIKRLASCLDPADSCRDSWLDFHISTGGFSGSLDEIRSRHFMVEDKNLLLRPYRLNGNSITDLPVITDKTRELCEKLSNSKRMELRDALINGSTAAESFMLQLDNRGLKLPVIGDSLSLSPLWVNDQTPFFDMLELVELYPPSLLKISNEEEHAR
jgi:hypothetical protein